MKKKITEFTAFFMIVAMLVSGCAGASAEKKPEEEDTASENAIEEETEFTEGDEWAYKTPDELEQGEAESVTLSADQPFYESQSGVYVDFGDYNGIDGDELTITPYIPEEVEDVDQVIYDVSLGDRHEFDYFFDICIPMEGNLDPEETDVIAEYYDEETGNWCLFSYDVCPEEQEVKIHTNHLTRIRVSKALKRIENQEIKRKYIHSKVEVKSEKLNAKTAMSYMNSVQQGEDKEAMGLTKLLVVDAIFANSFAGDVTKSGKLLTMEKFTPEDFKNTEKIVSSMKNVDNKIYERSQDSLLWLNDCIKAVDKAPLIQDVTENISSYGEYLAVASIAYDLVTKWGSTDLGKEQMASLASWAATSVTNKAINSAVVNCSMLGVMIIGWSLDELAGKSVKLKEDDQYAAMKWYLENGQEYTGENDWFSLESSKDAVAEGRRKSGDSKWDDLVINIYLQSAGDSEEFQKLLVSWMNSYTDPFFQLDETEMAFVYDAAGKKYHGSYFKDEEIKEKLQKKYNQEVMLPKLQPSFEKLAEVIAIEMEQQQSYMRTEALNTLNQTINIQVKDKAGADTKLEGARVSLVRKDEQYNSKLSFVLDGSGKANKRLSLKRYLYYGAPQECHVWMDGNNPNSNKPDLVVKLNYKGEADMKINLDSSKLKAPKKKEKKPTMDLKENYWELLDTKIDTGSDATAEGASVIIKDADTKEETKVTFDDLDEKMAANNKYTWGASSGKYNLSVDLTKIDEESRQNGVQYNYDNTTVKEAQQGEKEITFILPEGEADGQMLRVVTRCSTVRDSNAWYSKWSKTYDYVWVGSKEEKKEEKKEEAEEVVVEADEGFEKDLSLESFTWYDDVASSGFWQDSEQLSMDDANGDWYVLTIYNGSSASDLAATRTLSNMNINGAGGTYESIYMYCESDSATDISGFSNEIHVNGNRISGVMGNIDIESMVRYKGNDYGIGKYTGPDGMSSIFLMVR